MQLYLYFVCAYTYVYCVSVCTYLYVCVHVCVVMYCACVHLIVRFGPPIRYWCMRYEGKHNYFKDMAHRVKCFKNIPKTMACRHQEMLCYHLNSGNAFAKNIMTGPGLQFLLYQALLNTFMYQLVLLKCPLFHTSNRS